MPKGFNLRCAAGKTARVWLQGKGGELAPGHALVLLPSRAPSKDPNDDSFLQNRSVKSKFFFVGQLFLSTAIVVIVGSDVQ